MIDKYEISLKVFLKNKAGKYLILKAHPDCSYGGYYDFVGGRINRDEFDIDMRAILEREIKEEIGEHVQYDLPTLTPVSFGRHRVSKEFHGGDEDAHVMYLFFEATFLGGEITLSSEHTEMKWVDLAMLDIDSHFISGLKEGVVRYLER